MSSAIAGRAMGLRRGVILYGVLALTLMLGLFVLAFQTFVRHETGINRHLVAEESCWQLARSGVSAGLAWFENRRRPCPLQRLLVTRSPAALEGASVELPLGEHRPLQVLLRELGSRSSLRVRLELHAFEPLEDYSGTSPAGVVYGDVEKRGILQVVAEAQVAGRRRTLVGQKRVQVVSSVPFVVSKFTLFVAEMRDGSGPARKNSLDQLPLIQRGFSRADPDPADPMGILRCFHGDEPALEDHGFVFLGSQGEQILNLAFGDGSSGEAHHLLGKAWELVPFDDGPNSGYTSKFLQKGFFSGVREASSGFRHFPFDLPASDPPGQGASLLQLLGSADEPSAGVILGQLRRRFLQYRYLHEVASGKHVLLPWTSPSTWSPPPLPWSEEPSFDAAGLGFDRDYLRYATCMSEVFEQPYNLSVDQVVAGDLAQMVPPHALETPERVVHLDGQEEFLYRPEWNDGRVVLKTSGGAELFRGDLRDLSSADLRLPERATFTLPAAAFAGFLASDPTEIPGILHFQGGGVELDRSLQLREGGIVCVDGPITIRKAPKVQAGGRALSLVSLQGDITVLTEEPIQAALVALKGTLRKEAGKEVHLEGSLALGRLDARELLAGGGDVLVRYDGERLDPTRSGQAYSVYLAPERTLYER